MKFLINIFYLVVCVVLSPCFLYKMLRHGRYRTGWAQRFGKIVRKSPQKKSIWLHAVSVGEVNATKTLVKKLENLYPQFEIVISTTTDTGFKEANKLFGGAHTVTYFPFDLSGVMSRAFENIRPAICLLMELEVWPNFVQTADCLKIPVVVINGRITRRSCSRYKLAKSAVRKIFGKLTLVIAQTETYAGRFVQLGVPPEKVIVISSLKYDTAQIADKVDGADRLAKQLNIGNERLWVAGGTGPGEERIILDVFKALREQDAFGDLRLAIVPRKPERFDEVAELITQTGFDFVRYGSVKDTAAAVSNKVPVILGDTMGDLRKFYSLATIVFVGRSLVRLGGSDMIEAAALTKCTLFGPHTFNFEQTVEALLQVEGAIEVKDSQDLLNKMHKCLSDRNYASRVAQNGQNVIKNNQGATEKTIQQIAKFLK